MPLKLNVSLSRKIGQANYGSRGAIVGVELELDLGLVNKPDQLHSRIRQLFGLARSAVDEELRGDNGQAPVNPTANGDGREPSRPATAAQLRAVRAIAKQQRVNLEDMLRHEFGIARPEDLSLPQASQLIDQLKARGATAGGR
jgi:hypothetical protein